MGNLKKQGKKRKSTIVSASTTASTAPTTPRKARKQVELLTIQQYQPRFIGTRVLSCGEGEQIGHPGRLVTRKPRAIDKDTFPEGTKFLQVVAGGVHSVVLTTEGIVYSCGINEKGTVPVRGLKPEESTDKFTEIAFSPEIEKLGKIVQITAGASFSAALTENGSVIAWGNLRDMQGEVSINDTLNEIKKAPVIVLNHKKSGNKKIVKIAAGENHLVMLSEKGEILTFGEGSMGQLGRSVRTNHIRSRYMVDDTGNSLTLHVLEKGKFVFFVDIWAKGFWTMAKAEDGRIFTCGLNNFGQLGVFKRLEAPIRKSTAKRRLLVKDEPEPFVLSLSLVNNKSSKMDVDGDGTGTEESANDDVASGSTVKNGNEKRVEVGQEEANKIALFTHAEAFSSEKNWTHFSGVQHVVCRDERGEIWAIGKNVDNALGLGTWMNNDDNDHWRYDELMQVELPGGVEAAGLDATLGATIVWAQDGSCFAFGCDTVGQLGLGIKDDEEKVVPTPRLVHSAHLEGYRVISVSVADNHSLFLADKEETLTANGSLT